jgi:hypothetical protein
LAQLRAQEPREPQEVWPDQPSTSLYTDASDTTGWVSVLEPSHGPLSCHVSPDVS